MAALRVEWRNSRYQSEEIKYTIFLFPYSDNVSEIEPTTYRVHNDTLVCATTSLIYETIYLHPVTIIFSFLIFYLVNCNNDKFK